MQSVKVLFRSSLPASQLSSAPSSLQPTDHGFAQTVLGRRLPRALPDLASNLPLRSLPRPHQSARACAASAEGWLFERQIFNATTGDGTLFTGIDGWYSPILFVFAGGGTPVPSGRLLEDLVRSREMVIQAIKTEGDYILWCEIRGSPALLNIYAGRNGRRQSHHGKTPLQRRIGCQRVNGGDTERCGKRRMADDRRAIKTSTYDETLPTAKIGGTEQADHLSTYGKSGEGRGSALC